MTSDQGHIQKKEDEIDLVDIFSGISRRIRNFSNTAGRATLHIIFFLFRNSLWLAASILLGAGISFIIKLSTQDFYSSVITLSSNTIPNSEMISYVNKLHTFCREKNYDALASEMELSPGEAGIIKDIEAFWIIDMGGDNIPDYIDFRNRHKASDTVNRRMQDRFAIRIKTKDIQKLPKIRNGIIAYINSNSFFQDQNKLRLSQADDMLARIDYEIELLDSLQKVKYFEESRRLIPKEGGQMIFLQDYKTQLLYGDIASLITEKQALEKVNTIYADLTTLISDFTQPLKPVNRTLYYGKVIIPVVFFLAVILILLLKNRVYVTETYRKYQQKNYLNP
ncbi:MAG: hypothetical protein GX158_04375 [Bacteroidales bacterium]|nr:hypothetical protein [Bacteroidales bacterium]